MYLGVVVERAPAEELFTNPLHPYTRELLRSIPIPDLKPEHKLKSSIRGEVSDPIDPAPGCRFAPRCDQCNEKCKSRNFSLKEVAPGHSVACAIFEGFVIASYHEKCSSLVADALPCCRGCYIVRGDFLYKSPITRFVVGSFPSRTRFTEIRFGFAEASAVCISKVFRSFK